MISAVRHHDQKIAFDVDAIKAQTNVIQDFSEPRDIRHGIRICAHEGGYSDRGRYYKICFAHGAKRL